MKQTLEAAASEYYERNKTHLSKDLFRPRIIDIFKAGAGWQTKQSPWISVNERLPEENTGVFFTVEWNDCHKGYFVGLYYGDGQWESDHRIFLPDSSLGCITHWMPIPKFD